MNQHDSESAAQPQPKWKPLGRVERRVLGVLVEKAKTTPDAYPLTLNALTNGCNQKSNRDPQMNLEPHQVENALENLRREGAVLEVSGGGRVSKYRHLIYEWMGVNKVEAAVMTELLLRGAQTLGDLRGRAARMEPIADVNSLQPIVQDLIDRRLIMELTPPGRGQTVTHALYQPEELEKVRSQFGGAPRQAPTPSAAARPAHATAPPVSREPAPPQPTAASSSTSSSEIEQLRQEVHELKQEVNRLKSDVQDLWNSLN